MDNFAFKNKPMLSVNQLIVITVFILFLFSYLPICGEGSQNYNANGTLNRDAITYINGNPIHTRPTTHYVYLKAGETMYIGTATYQNDDKEITVKNPAGVTLSYNVTKDGNGFIKNRIQELSGPNTINANGYKPITYTADTEGIYIVDFFGNNAFDYETVCDYLVEEDWDIDSDCANASILAWDITVVNTSGAKLDGRVFCHVMGYSLYKGKTASSFFVLTNNGYQYRVYLNGIYPISYIITANNTGNMINGRTAYSSYAYPSAQIENPNHGGWSTYEGSNFEENSHGQVTYRLFYNKPNSELLTYLGLPADGTPLQIEISDFQFKSASVDKINSSIKGDGGTFEFKSNHAFGKYTLTLSFENGKTITHEGKLETENSIYWDGKDSENNIVEEGTFTAELKVLPGETHIVLSDIEYMENGIKIQHLNGVNSGSYKIKYNHLAREIDGSWNDMDTVTPENNSPAEKVSLVYKNGWMVNEEDDTPYLKNTPDQSEGIDSSNGASATDNLYSDIKKLDFWFNDDYFEKITISIEVYSNRSIKVSKKWEDNNDQWQLRPASVIFDAFPGDSTASSGSCTADSSNQWECTISELPVLDGSGNEITYNIVERTVPGGYTGTNTQISDINEDTAEITNTLQVRDIEISKNWEDLDDTFSLRPDEITYDVYIGEGTDSVGNCTANSEGDWKCTITGLPKYGTDGNVLNYVIKERAVPKPYSASEKIIDNAETVTAEITNTLVLKDIEVSKTWEGDLEDLFSTRSDSITFDALYGEDIYGSCTTDSEHDWKCVIENLPVYNASGEEIAYTVREHEVPVAYTSEDTVVSSKDTVEAEVTNTLVTKDIVVEKSWEDQENKFSLQPDSITYDIYAAGIEDPVGSCTADKETDWSCTFTGLPKIDASGEPIVYTVKEHEVPKSYTATESTVDTADGVSAEITNTLVVKDIEVSKVWEGDLDDLYSTRPVQITFDVYYGETVYGSCSARVEDGWKCSVTDLAVYDKSGEPIVYSVKERNVPRAYTADEPTVTEAEQTSVSLTNTLITKDLVVTKIWEDNENAYSMRASSLKFDLYQNDEKKDSCTVSSDTSWKCTFSGLPVYDPLGLEQKYVIKETEVPVGYSTADVTVSGKDTVAAEVTNKLETKDITVIKNWTDSNDHDRKRPESIVLKLFKDGELFKTKEINAAENSLSANVWSYVFTNIPKYNERGEPAVYSVKEFPSG